MNIYILHTQITDLPKQDLACSVNLIDLKESNSYDKIGLSNEACIIFYQNPTAILTSLLKAGIASTQAIKESEDQVTFLVKTFKKSRSKVRLVSMDNAEMIAGIPELKECSQILNDFKKSVENTEYDLHDIVAKLLVMQNRSLLKLSQHLEACSEVPFQDMEIDINQILDHDLLKKEQDASELESLKVNLQKEQQLIKQQTAELQSINQQLAQEKKASKEQLQKLTENLNQVEEENKLIIQQLHSTQESLETNLEKVEAQNKTKIQLEQELAHSQNALKQEQQATLEKQAELQSVQNQLVKEQKTSREQTQKLSENLKQVEEENELIIQQLHSVQEDLEYQLISKQELVMQHSVISSSSQDMSIYNAWIRLIFNRTEKQNFNNNRKHRTNLKKQIKLIKSSDLFDAEWYLTNYPDLKEAGVDPALHYLQFGAVEGRNPSSGFNTLNYVFSYSDVAESGINPLVHFLKFGHAERREADPRRKCLPAPKKQGL